MGMMAKGTMATNALQVSVGRAQTKAIMTAASIQVASMQSLAEILRGGVAQDNAYYAASEQYFGNIQAALEGIQEDMAALKAVSVPTDISRKENEATIRDVIDPDDGTFSLSDYLKVVRRNIDASPAGMLGTVGDMLKPLVHDPFGFIIDQMGEKLFNMGPFKRIREFSEGLSFRVLSSLRGAIDRTESPLIKNILRMFNITGDPLAHESRELGSVPLGRIPFDGETKRSIVEVIPTLLSKMLSALQKKGPGADLIFNQETGLWQTRNEIIQAYKDRRVDAINEVLQENPLIELMMKDAKWRDADDAAKIDAQHRMGTALAQIGMTGMNLRRGDMDWLKTAAGDEEMAAAIQEFTQKMDDSGLADLNKNILYLAENMNRSLEEELRDDPETRDYKSHVRAALAERGVLGQFRGGYTIDAPKLPGVGGGGTDPGSGGGAFSQIGRSIRNWFDGGDADTAFGIHGGGPTPGGGGSGGWLSRMGGHLRGFGGPVLDFFRRVGTSFGSFFSRGSEQFRTKLVDPVRTALIGQESVDGSAERKEGLFGILKNTLNDWMDKARGFLFGDDGLFAKILNPIKTGGKKAWEYVLDKIWAPLKGLGQDVKETFLDKIWAPLKDMGSSLKESIKENVWNPIKGVGRHVRDNVLTPFWDGIKSGWDKTKTALDGLKTPFQEFTSYLSKTWSGKLIEFAKNSFSKIGRTIGDSIISAA